MFEYEGMSLLANESPRNAPRPRGVREEGARAETLTRLQDRIRSMQRTEIDSAPLPTLPAVAALLPGGSLRAGAVYSVGESMSLVMAMMAGPSAAGAWCAVVGIPGFGVEAAARTGVNLERLVLVPTPGARWLEVAAAVADVATVVVARPPLGLAAAELERLSSRLRQRGSILLALGPWPRSEARLVPTAGSWAGIGEGHGYLSARELGVEVTDRAGFRRRGGLSFPEHGGVAAPDPAAIDIRRPQDALPGAVRGAR